MPFRSITIKQRLAIICFFAALMLLLWLGFWQLDRGRQKQSIQQAVSANSRHTPVILAQRPVSWSELQYAPVTLQGRWLDKPRFRLANRFYQHRPGYDIYNLFQLPGDGSVIAVNRGWIGLEQTPPALVRGTGSNRISGIVQLPGTGFTLGPAATDGATAQVELQYLDLDTISELAGHTVEPAVFILQENSPNSLQYHWQPIVMSPQRHYAYALQWFALAVTWSIFGVIWFRRMKQRSAGAAIHSANNKTQ